VSRPLASTTSPATSGGHSSTAEPLRGRSLILARTGWLVIAAFTLSLFVTGLPSEFATLGSVCKTGCVSGQLSPGELRALHDLGLSTGLYAAYGAALDVVFAAVYGAVAAAIFWRRPDDRMALFVSIALLTFGTTTFPNAASALAATHHAWWWPFAFLNFLGSALFGLFLYVFPDGRFVPRWTRWVALAWIFWQLPRYWFPGWDTSDLDSLSSWLSFVVWSAALGTVVYSQVYRYRRVSNAVQRQQIKWVLLGTSAAVLTFLGVTVALSIFVPASTTPGTLIMLLVGSALIYAAMLLIPLSIGVAILRYHLFDIDLIINRALVYGALTASVVGLYVLVVGGLGEIFRLRGNLIVSLLAAGMVAVLFAPLRTRLQRGVNHLMYGERDEPYKVLSRLGERLEATLAPEAVLPTAVRTVREALKVPYVAVDLARDGVFETAAAAGEPVPDSQSFPLVYGGEKIGRLVLGPRTGEEAFSPADRRLLGDLVHQIGVAAHAVRLTDEAIRLSADLQRSRGRLITAQEEERRRLRRDLHDGLGPQLAGLTMTAEAARDLISTDPERAEELLGDLMERAQGAVSDVRTLVYALRPPALDALGLLGALRAQTAHQEYGGLRIQVDERKQLPPLSAAVEVAAYRIVLEALNNVVRHADARNCAVRLVLDEGIGELRVEVIDDGKGIADGHNSRGIGLSSMRERAVELGGSFEIEDMPSGGTHVRARLPYSTGEDLPESKAEEV
jgi:signal transduction histidine kinase